MTFLSNSVGCRGRASLVLGLALACQLYVVEAHAACSETSCGYGYLCGLDGECVSLDRETCWHGNECLVGFCGSGTN